MKQFKSLHGNRKLPAADLAKMIEMYVTENASVVRIANKFNVSSVTVNRAIFTHYYNVLQPGNKTTITIKSKV